MITNRKRPCNVRISKDSPYYPMSYNGYISPARLAMAKHLNRCLGSDEYIYNIDGDPFNTDISNLRLVSHKELTKLNEIRRVTSQIERLISRLSTLETELADIQFHNIPCNCPKCTKSREARQAGYHL